jgi:hypothetical protein
MKKILFIIILFLLTIIISNKIAKQFLKQTKFEKNEFVEKIKFVYGEEYQDYLKVYKQQSYPVKYSPLTEFIEQKRNYEFVSIGEYGNRCNKNKIQNCQIPKGGKNEIWIFGGSTVFGYGLKNDETIAAHLENYTKNKNVINFGQGHYHSTQSRILFQNLLVFFPPPETVIFLDGFNDFKINQINNYQFPIQTSLTKNFEDIINKKEISISKKLKNWFKKRYNRLNIVRLYKERTESKTIKQSNEILVKNIDEAYNSLVYRLMTNFKINKSIGEKFDINIINILEPISLSKQNYSSSNIPKKYLDNFDKKFYHYKNIYKIIQTNDELLSFVDINMINLNIKESMFVDLTHYSNEFSNKIAFEIFQDLNN